VNDLSELKNYVVAHAKTQRLQGYQQVLDRIRTDGSGPGSWAHEWSAAATEWERQGKIREACRCFVMARFPFVDGEPRRAAQDNAVRAFGGWAKTEGIEPLAVDAPGGPMRCWSIGLSRTERRPLVVIMGGIVSVKEQWGSMLPFLRKQGLAGIAMELPGIGENTGVYTAESWKQLPAVLDAVRDRCDVSRTYALMFSFSGHMALRSAVDDPRIRGIVTGGAPVRGFFTDDVWLRKVPRVTLDTLAHLTGHPVAELPEVLRGWAMSPGDLSALDIPVACSASLRDEIIPPSDLRILRENVRDLWLLEHDDVHAAPAHFVETQLFVMQSLLRMRKVRNLQSLGVGLLLRAARARGRRISAAAKHAGNP
jgi:esterase FrsA